MRTKPLRLTEGTFGLILALELGALVRLMPVALHAFPLNDGGLFFQMTEDLVSNRLLVPAYTTYNGGEIPFAYPPLGFLLAACIHVASRIALVELMRWLPAIFSLLTIPLVFILARRVLPDTRLAGTAALVFALIPRSHEWLIMGGGLARAPAMVFALLALIQMTGLVHRPTWRSSLGLGTLLGLAAMTHLEMAWFAVLSVVLVWAVRGRTGTTLAYTCAAGALAAALSALWWLPVLKTHGTIPFVESALTAQHSATTTAAILTNFTGEPYLTIYLTLGVIGTLVCIGRREFLLPLWLLLPILFDPRAAGTDASAPLAMLISVAIDRVVLPLTSTALASLRAGLARLPPTEGTVQAGWIRGAVVVAVAAYGTLAALLAPFTPTSSIAVLRPDELKGVEWAEANLPPTSQFLIVSGREAWGSDPLSEWFPALTSHVSIVTPNGQEWTGAVGEVAALHRALQACGSRGVRCLNEWLAEKPAIFEYLMVATYPDDSGIQTVALNEGIARSTEYEPVFANSDLSIYAHNPAP